MVAKERIQKFELLMNRTRLIFSRMRSDLALSQGELAVLITIARRSSLMESGENMSASTSDIAKHMGTTMPATSKMIRNLSMKGYIRQIQSQHDRRVMHLALTEKGEAILDNELCKRQNLLKGVLHKFGEEKTTQLLDLMTELLVLIEKEAEEKKCLKF